MEKKDRIKLALSVVARAPASKIGVNPLSGKGLGLKIARFPLKYPFPIPDEPEQPPTDPTGTGVADFRVADNSALIILFEEF